MLALAAGVQSSLIAAHAPGVSYVTSAIHPAGPWGHGAWGGPWGGPYAHGPAAVDLGAYAAPWAGPWAGPWGGPGHYGGYPGISLSQGPGHAAAAHGPGVYVAKTRGAIHTAPLAGHIASATSVNVAPAPGTH